MQEEGAAGRVGGNVDVQCRPDGEHKHFAARTGDCGIGVSRAIVGQTAVRRRRGQRVTRHRPHLETVTARRHKGKPKSSRRQIVDLPAAVGHAGACGDSGGKTADAVVAEHRGRQAGGIVDQGHGDAVERRTGHGIEHRPQGIDQRNTCRRIGRVERILVIHANARVGRNRKLPVARCHGHGRTDAGNHGGKHAAVGGRFLHQQGFGIGTCRIGAECHTDHFPHQGIQIAIRIGQREIDRCIDVINVGGPDFDESCAKIDETAATGARRELIKNHLGRSGWRQAVQSGGIGDQCCRSGRTGKTDRGRVGQGRAHSDARGHPQRARRRDRAETTQPFWPG